MKSRCSLAQIGRVDFLYRKEKKDNAIKKIVYRRMIRLVLHNLCFYVVHSLPLENNLSISFGSIITNVLSEETIKQPEGKN